MGGFIIYEARPRLIMLKVPRYLCTGERFTCLAFSALSLCGPFLFYSTQLLLLWISSFVILFPCSSFVSFSFLFSIVSFLLGCYSDRLIFRLYVLL